MLMVAYMCSNSSEMIYVFKLSFEEQVDICCWDIDFNSQVFETVLFINHSSLI